ncbi:MAG: AAA family ATPase [Verrucomicrobiota bacterium]
MKFNDDRPLCGQSSSDSTVDLQTTYNLELKEWLRLPIYEEFKNKPIHMLEAKGEWDGYKLYQDFQSHVVRSTFDEADIFEGQSQGWDRILFRFDDELYVYFSYGYLYVYAPTKEYAHRCLDDLRNKYIIVKKEEPTFYLVKYNGCSIDLQSVKIDRNKEISSNLLALQYGETFNIWEDELVEAIEERDYGITLLQGAPGTGKTSFIRHLVAKLADTHRFYFIPPSNFKMLKDPEFVDFWSNQSNHHKEMKKIVILEDAEGILLPRQWDNRDELSALLNITDGLLGEFLKLHLICTINCSVSALDPAVLRPGRLIARKQFKNLTQQQAIVLANKLGKPLQIKETYSLAEIYTETSESELNPPKPAIGF